MIPNAHVSGAGESRSFWAAAAAHVAAVAALLLTLTSLVFATAATAAPTYPALTGQIVDQANLISPEDEAAILADLKALEGTSTDQVAVVTVNSLEGYPIEDYGIGLARQWQIGQKDKDNGVLLLVAPNERRVRIEVGRRLEPIMTDIMSAAIIDTAILPRFRRGDFSGGIRAGVQDIKNVLLGDAEAVRDRAKSRTPEDDPMVFVTLLIFIAIVILMMWLSARAERQAAEADMATPYDKRRSRRRRPGGIIVIPGGSSDWGGGWSGGGGGWSGGGGGFGGGGSSGSW
jgi:uncharacterized protein